MSLVETTTDGVNWDITTYKYNDNGIRVEKNYNGTVTTYLVDSHNHTGFAQVLEEWDTTSTPTLIKTYIIGDDIIGHADDTGDITYLLYDGQGSVRHHSDANGNLIAYSGCDTFAYDAYGQRVDPLKDVINEGLFYAGEMYDSESDQYYLRARYYNPLNGRFNRMDDFSGNYSDPQSLHKYLYCQNNPINSIDPTGEMTFIGTLSVVTIICSITSVFLPVIGGVISAVKGGISPWEFIGELVSKITWQEALLAIGIGASVGALLKWIASKVGAKIFSVICAVLSVYALIKSIGLTINMVSDNISRRDIVHYLAFTTAVLILSILIGNILRKPEQLPGSGKPPKEPGIYEFNSASGKVYVGQSDNFYERMNKHLSTGKLRPKDIKTLRWKPMKGSSRIDREIAEQLRIEAHGGIKNLENVINAIGRNRRHLMPK